MTPACLPNIENLQRLEDKAKGWTIGITTKIKRGQILNFVCISWSTDFSVLMIFLNDPIYQLNLQKISRKWQIAQTLFFNIFLFFNLQYRLFSQISQKSSFWIWKELPIENYVNF